MKKVITEVTMLNPVGSSTVSSPFGEKRKNETHPGVDIPVPSGTPIKAPLDGIVKTANISHNRMCGGTIDIDYGNGYWSRFCHCRKIDVKPGDIVKRGQVVGLTGGRKGETGAGNSGGPHLHFTLKKDGRLVNPMDHVDKISVGSGDFSMSGATPSSDSGTNWDDFFSEKGVTSFLPKSKKFSDPILGQILKPLEDALNLKTEMRQIIKPLTESYSLKNGNQYSSYEYVINTGKDIVSPEKGIVVSVGNISECKNALIISHVIGGKKYYTNFCNVDRPKVSKNETVKAGQIVGASSTNVLVTILNSSKTPIKFREIDSIEKKIKDNDNDSLDIKDTKSSSRKSNNPLLSLLLKPLDVLNMDDFKTVSKSDKVPEYKWVNWAKKNISSTSKNESIERNINKIKKLL
jgi:murein DD-endopeptidase MepM/ murein hydrolase activator NlpD